MPRKHRPPNRRMSTTEYQIFVNQDECLQLSREFDFRDEIYLFDELNRVMGYYKLESSSPVATTSVEDEKTFNALRQRASELKNTFAGLSDKQRHQLRLSYSNIYAAMAGPIPDGLPPGLKLADIRDIELAIQILEETSTFIVDAIDNERAKSEALAGQFKSAKSIPKNLYLFRFINQLHQVYQAGTGKSDKATYDPYDRENPVKGAFFSFCKKCLLYINVELPDNTLKSHISEATETKVEIQR